MLMAIGSFCGLVAQAAADSFLQWGEAPSGAGTGGTNIVVPPNKNIVFTNRLELMTYSGLMNNPAVGGTNYYWDSAGRAPHFSAAVSDSSLGINPVMIVEQANSGDRITIYGGNVAPGGTYRGMVMWTFSQYHTGAVVSLSSVAIAINQRLNADTTNQAVRVVVQAAGSHYISGGASFGANVVTQSFDLAGQTWYAFTPFVSGTETIGASVPSPGFTNLQAVGYFFTAQNGGAAGGAVGAQVQYFAANGVAVPIPTLQEWALLLLAGLLGYLGWQRLRPARGVA